MTAEVINLAERRLLRDGYVEIATSNAAVVGLCQGCREWKPNIFQWTPEHGLRCEACAS